LLGGGLAFVATRRVPSNYDDAWVYLSWVRDFMGAERLALRDPYFGERTAELSRVKVNGWLLEQAALSRVSGLDPIEMVLRYLTPTLVVVALLAVYALARVLLKSERAAVLSATVYALFHVVFIEPSVHNVGVELAVRIAEDKHAARFLVLPVALLSAALFVEGRKLRYLGLFAFLCWTTVAVHPSVLAPLGLCMLGFGLVHVAANPRRRTAWAGMAALALAMWSVVLGPLLLLFRRRVARRRAVLRGHQRDPPRGARVHGVHHGELAAHLRVRRRLVHDAPLAAAEPGDTRGVRAGRPLLAAAGQGRPRRPTPPRRSGRGWRRGLRAAGRHVRGGEVDSAGPAVAPGLADPPPRPC
jgi:hypothetical protein